MIDINNITAINIIESLIHYSSRIDNYIKKNSKIEHDMSYEELARWLENKSCDTLRELLEKI